MPERILVTRTDRIGDVVLSLPVIENLRRAFKQSYLAILIRPYTAPLLKNNPFLDEVIIYDKYNRHKSLAASLKFAYELRKKRFDLALILHPTNRMHLVTFLAGIKKRVGWQRKIPFLLTDSLPHTKQKGQKHERDYNFDLLRFIGVKPYDIYPHLFPDPKAEVWAESFWQAHNLKGKFVVALGLGASCVSKIWPPDYFGRLAKILKDKYAAEIIVLAQDFESHLRDKFASSYKESFIDLTGQLDILQLISLFRRCRLFVGNDSGLVHMAAAVDTFVISIFGRNQPGLSPRRWHPLGTKSAFVHKDVGCQVCHAHNCQRDFLCLKSIKPQEVAEAADSLLREN